VIVGKLDGKVAVITGGSSGMALAGTKLFVDEGAHVFISGRRQDALDEAVKLIGRNIPFWSVYAASKAERRNG
jgi:NADP-dependent 3-hydroxy acid dehydrogenase YdfG